MKKEPVNKFDLEAAFKALDEISVPVVRGIRPNREDLQEKFTKKLVTDILVEDYYDVNDSADLEAAQEDREAEIAKAKLARIEKIVDLEAESEEDLLPSYVGKVIIQCPQCMTLFYKNQEDISKSEENPEVVNINEVCQHCGNSSGYTLVGKVDTVGEEEAEQYDLDAFEDDELNLDFPEGTEETDPEGTGEAANEEENTDLDLDLNLEEPEEEPAEEEEEVKESLNEAVEDSVEDTEEEIEEESVEILTSVEEIKEVAVEAAEAVLEASEEETLEDIKEVTDEVVEDHFEVSEEEVKEEPVEETEEAVVEDEAEEVVEESLNENAPKTIIIRKPGTSDETIEVPVVNGYAEYKDENGNMKKVPVAESLNEAKTTKQRLTVIEPGYQYEDKDGSVYTLYGNECEEDSTGLTYDWEFVDDENGDIYIFLLESLTESLTAYIDLSGSQAGKQKEYEKVAADNGATTMIAFTDSFFKPVIKGSKKDKVLLITGDDDYKVNAPELVNNKNVKVIHVGKTNESLTEAVDKELDDKLKAHNEYIDYLKEMIEKEEKSLANAKNDFVKKSIQSRIDALKADLEAALPEALKNEVVVNDDLPTPEEANIEDAAENKEETTESLNESIYKVKYNYKATDEQAKDQEPKEAEETIEANSWTEAEDKIEAGLVSKGEINNKRPFEINILEVNGEKYDSFIKGLDKAKAGNNAKEVKESLNETYYACAEIDGEERRFPFNTREEAKNYIDMIQKGEAKEFEGKKIGSTWTESLKEETKESLTEEVKIIGDLSDYSPWSGAVDTWNKIQDAGLVDDLDTYLEECYPEGLTMTELNDILWFEGEEILNYLGLGEEEIDEALLDLNIDARGQSVGIAGGTGGSVSNDMTESFFEEKCKRAEQKGYVEVKVDLNPSEACKCQMIIKDDSGKKHYFTTPEFAADLERAYGRYNRGNDAEQLDEFVGPAVASIAGASVANNLINKAFESCEDKEALTEADLLDAVFDSEEFKKPISDEEVRGILSSTKFHENFNLDLVEEFDENSFDKHVNGYLKEVYENVNNFETTKCEIKHNKLVVEGLIKFNSGNAKETTFVFEAVKNNLVGKNTDLAPKKAFALKYNINNSTLFTEGFKYRYSIENTLVEGLIK